MNLARTDYPCREIAPGVFEYLDFGVAACYLLLGEKRALLIDCGMGLGDLPAVLKQHTALPIDVVATHGHCDHSGGMGQFEKVYIHPGDIGRAKRHMYLRRPMVLYSKGQNTYGITLQNIQKRVERTQLIPLKDGHRFLLGGRTVTVHHTPGHSLGSIVLRAEEDKLLFAGDNLNYGDMWMFVPGSTTLEAWLPGAQRMLSLAKDCALYAGHGGGLEYEKCVRLKELIERIVQEEKNKTISTIKTAWDGDDVRVRYRTGNVRGKPEQAQII